MTVLSASTFCLHPIKPAIFSLSYLITKHKPKPTIMRKLFTLLLLVLWAAGTMAQTTVTITCTGAAGSYKSGSVSSAGTKNDGNMTTINSSSNRGWAQFDLSSLAGATVTAVTANFTTYTSTSSTATNNLYGFLGDPATMAGATLYTSCGSGTSFNASSWAANAANSKVFTAAGITFVNTNVGGVINIGYVRGSTNTYNIYGYPGTPPPTLSITYTGGAACSGTPAPGNTVSSANPACTGTPFTLSLQNPTAGSGLTYQWQSSPDGTTWTNITGATSFSYVATQSVATYYICHVTCSGSTGTSNPLQVTMNPFYTCYCPSAAGSTSDEEITNVTFGTTLNNTSACASLTGSQGTATGTPDLYSNFQSITPTVVTQGVSEPVSVQVTECAGSAYSHDVRVYVDFNHNGSFGDAGEEFIIWPYASSNTHVITSSILIPMTALTGVTGMRVVCKESTTTGPCVIGSWGETEDYLIDIAAPAPCTGTPTPGNTVASANPSCQGASFTLSLQTFTPGAGVTYQWESSPDGTTWTPISGATNNTLVTSQMTDTYYQCLVTCSGSTGTSAPLFVTTFVQPTEFIENADGVTAPALPSCWTKFIAAAASSATVTTTTSAPHSAPNCFALYNSAAATAADAPILVSPYLSNVNDGLHQLRFYAKGNGTTLSVQVGTMTNPAVGTTFTPLATVTGLTTTGWTEYVVSFAAYTGTDHHIAFRHPATATYTYVYLDNLNWELIPTCPQPLNVVTSNVTNASADLTWTNGGAETTWNIIYGAPGFDPSHGGTVVSGITSHPYTLSGLSPQTGYDWYVQADCGGGSVSNWDGPGHFVTLCDPIPNSSFPWTENFDAMATVGNNILPTCWASYSPTGTPWYSGNAASISYNDPCSAPNYVYVSYSPTSSNKELFTPAFILKAGSSYDFKFKWIGDGYSGWTGDVFVNTVPSETGATQLGTSFVTSGTTTTAACTEVMRSYVAPANGTYYFFVRVVSNSTPWYLGFDDFSLDNSPACPMPTSLTALPAGFQAHLGWTASGAVSYDIEWGPSPVTYTGTPTITGVANPYILTGLTPTTGYGYKVRSNCGGGNYSVWSSELTFTTTVACPPPTTLTASGLTGYTANLGWTEPGTATLWNIEYGPSGFTQGTGTMVTGVTTNPYTLSGLTPSTSYAFYVQSDCGGGSTSTWAGPLTFATTCIPAALPACEMFAGAAIPACWTQNYSGSITSNRWSVSTTTTAGGTANEMKCTWVSGTGTSRLISPQYTVTGIPTAHLAFRQMFDDYSSGADVSIALDYRVDGGAWVTAWTHAGGINANIAAELKEFDVPVSGNTVEFSWTVIGNHYDFDYWYIDEVCVSVPLAHDAKMISIDNVAASGPTGTVFTPKATVKNVGTNAEVFDVTMTGSDGYISTVTGVSLAAGASTQVTFANWTPATGPWWTLTACTMLTGDLDPSNDCQFKKVYVKPATKIYAYNAYDPTSTVAIGPCWFNDVTPGTITSLAAGTSTNFISAGSWVNGTWYGGEYRDTVAATGGGWYSINHTTGAMTLIAPTTHGYTGIAYDHGTNVLYACEYDQLLNYNKIFTVDPLTGTATRIGTVGAGELYINLATDGSGSLYAIGLGTDHLFKIDIATMAVTDVGAVGFNLNYAQDMGFDYSSNTLYAAAYTTTGQLLTINTTSGSGTLVGNFQGGCELEGVAIPYSTAPLAVTGTATNVTGCFGNTNGSIATTVTGGYAPYTYFWSNAATTANLTGIGAGTYSVTVTDALLATVTGSWVISQPAELALSTVLVNASCPTANDGSINLTVTGGTSPFTFAWSNGSTNEDVAELLPGTYQVTVTDANGCIKTGSWVITYIDPVCNYTSVTGTISTAVCRDAHITITAANLTVVAPTGSLTLIAGQNIHVQPNTAVQSGAYAHFYISTTFCGVVPPMPAVQATGGVETDGRPSLQVGTFNLFPNPTNGNFTLVQKNDRLYGNVKVEVYGMNGNRIMTESMTGEKKHEFGFSNIPAGLYFVKIIADDTVETIKLVKTR